MDGRGGVRMERRMEELVSRKRIRDRKKEGRKEKGGK